MNLANLANLAKAPSMPDSVKIRSKTTINYTILTWQRPKTGKVKGYYVLIRETTSPVWQKKIFTTQTEITLALFKGQLFFCCSIGIRRW